MIYDNITFTEKLHNIFPQGDFQLCNFFGGEAAFLQQQLRDKIKKDYCEKHGIELIIIPYNTQKNILTTSLAQRLGGQVTED